jgi:LmbE family N-acetylglucosaminyl deacetylase
MDDDLCGWRLAAVFPHPDDESFAAGGTLAACAARGAEVAVVSATRGEGGRDRRGRVASGDALGRLRSAELEEACRVLGVMSPCFLELGDGSLASQHSEGVKRLTQALERLAPHVVITFGPDGGYGHRDHVALSAMCSQAVKGATRLLHSAFPRGLLTELCRRVERGRPALMTEIDPASLGIARRDADLVVDVRGHAAVKRAALACHRSQIDGDPDKLLGRGVIERLCHEEWFVLAAGPALPAGSAHPFSGLAAAGATSA